MDAVSGYSHRLDVALRLLVAKAYLGLLVSDVCVHLQSIGIFHVIVYVYFDIVV